MSMVKMADNQELFRTIDIAKFLFEVLFAGQ